MIDIQFYIKQFFKKYTNKKARAITTIHIILAILIITSQSYTYAYIDIVGENLPPFATMDISKKGSIDINIVNDGTTGYTTSTLSSKINEILKTRLAQEGIEYKVNVIDVDDKIINSKQSNLKTIDFDTGKKFYPLNKIGPFGADYSKICGGIKGTISYIIQPNKLTISSYSLDNEAQDDFINCANDRYLYINFYSDYIRNNLIQTSVITNSKIGRAEDSPNDPDKSSGNNIEINFSNDVKSFDLLVDGNFTISKQYGGVFSYLLMQDGNTDLQWLNRLSIYSDKIKRKAFISENMLKLTWSQDSDKYYVDFSNREYPENIYGEGKADSLSCLLNKNINLIKLGDTATKEDAIRIINENNDNGQFIGINDLDSAIAELVEYIISKSKKHTSSKLENGSYVIVSENEIPLEFEAGGLNEKTGAQAVNLTSIRSKEYIEVDSGGNYLINENKSGIDYVNIYFYDNNLSIVNCPIKVATNIRFSIPINIDYIKLTCPVIDMVKANRMTIINNDLDSGETLKYKPSVTDNENDSADIMYKFHHDNNNINGCTITNESEKSAFSGIEMSAPIERFTKPGTYEISMYAKDIPKQIADTTNLLPNGNAEIIDTSGDLLGWSTWAENFNITTFGRRVLQPFNIGGNGSFEISTEHQELQDANFDSNGELDATLSTKSNTISSMESCTQPNTVYNSACYYRDIAVAPNTSYFLSGLLATYNCSGNFVIYEMDDSYNILKYYSSNRITNTITNTNTNTIDNTSPLETSSISFTIGFTTTWLRIHIVKYETSISEEAIANKSASKELITDTPITNASLEITLGEITAASPENKLDRNRSYLFADNITLVKVLPNSNFNNYRKTSKPATTTIYAHRLPRADFTYQIENDNGTFKIKNLEDNQLSYDPDHTDKANKGITNSIWRWAEISTNGKATWNNGKVPETQKFLTGTQVIIWYKVQDSDGRNGKGEWSKPKVISTDGSLVDPLALFIATPDPLPMQNELIITDQSYSPNFKGTIESRTWTIKKLSTGKTQTLSFDKIDTANGKFYKKFTSLGFGKYTITLSVTDSYGKVSKPYSKTINVIDTINPTVSVSLSNGNFSGEEGAAITVTCADSYLGKSYNRGLKSVSYAWSKNSVQPQENDIVKTLNFYKEGLYSESFTASQVEEGIWYLYVKDKDYADNVNNNESYTRFGPYSVDKIKAGNFFITMMLDIGWRAYYFDVLNGIDDNHDGVSERYPRRTNTDIGTLKMPINYYNLVGYNRTYIKAGYKVKGKIDILGEPDYAKFNINYTKEGKAYTDTVYLTMTNGNTYTFEWIIPLETDDKTFISFDLITKKGNITYGNEKWLDRWDARNKSRLVFYVKGKATDDITYVQSQ